MTEYPFVYCDFIFYISWKLKRNLCRQKDFHSDHFRIDLQNWIYCILLIIVVIKKHVLNKLKKEPSEDSVKNVLIKLKINT